MASKPVNRMPLELRAKQFMPFSALKGLEEELRLKEKVVMEKKELSDDMAVEINYMLQTIGVGNMISVIHFNNGEYVRTVGLVAKNCQSSRILQVVHVPILYEDIFELKYV